MPPSARHGTRRGRQGGSLDEASVAAAAWPGPEVVAGLGLQAVVARLSPHVLLLLGVAGRGRARKVLKAGFASLLNSTDNLGASTLLMGLDRGFLQLFILFLIVQEILH